jgi:hypothetical protein
MKKNKNLSKIVPTEDVKLLILNNELLPIRTIDSTLKKLSTKIIPNYYNEKNKKKKDEIWEKLREASGDVMYGLETETHVLLMESVDRNYMLLAKDFSDQIIKDYSCTTSIEKALAEVITNAYIRILDNSRRLNNELNADQITQNRNIYFANLSKQLDRAHRQFDSAIFSLRQLKQPNVEVSVKATNAFLSQNQQINVNENNEKKNIET